MKLCLQMIYSYKLGIIWDHTRRAHIHSLSVVRIVSIDTNFNGCFDLIDCFHNIRSKVELNKQFIINWPLISDQCFPCENKISNRIGFGVLDGKNPIRIFGILIICETLTLIFWAHFFAYGYTHNRCKMKRCFLGRSCEACLVLQFCLNLPSYLFYTYALVCTNMSRNMRSFTSHK